ncbi:hypothetical protein Patl1_37097 [Pistacia atlantica]|nr:hypothetical protein Patl1_37097 [Pistacia atlantica]
MAYIAFVTVATPPEDEIIALGEALDELNIPFIWSLNDEKKKQMPEKFMRRSIEHCKWSADDGRPLFKDHGMNGRMVEEVWGIGMKVKSLVFTKNEVAKSLKVIFGDEKRKKMRENVEEIVMKAAGS